MAPGRRQLYGFAGMSSPVYISFDNLCRASASAAVKLALSRRLPVVLEGGVGPTSPEKASSVTDSQLVNTVYLDSPSLELYHGRLSKTPGAVALRLRWYGAGEPRRVFVERKTHRDAWAGDETVRDRFAVLPEGAGRRAPDAQRSFRK